MAASDRNHSASATWLTGTTFTILAIPLAFFGAQPFEVNIPLKEQTLRGKLDDFALQYIGAAAAVSLGCGALCLAGKDSSEKKGSDSISQPSAEAGTTALLQLQAQPQLPQLNDEYLNLSGLSAFLDSDDSPIIMRPQVHDQAHVNPVTANQLQGEQAVDVPNHQTQVLSAAPPATVLADEALGVAPSQADGMVDATAIGSSNASPTLAASPAQPKTYVGVLPVQGGNHHQSTVGPLPVSTASQQQPPSPVSIQPTVGGPSHSSQVQPPGSWNQAPEPWNNIVQGDSVPPSIRQSSSSGESEAATQLSTQLLAEVMAEVQAISRQVAALPDRALHQPALRQQYQSTLRQPPQVERPVIAQVVSHNPHQPAPSPENLPMGQVVTMPLRNNFSPSPVLPAAQSYLSFSRPQSTVPQSVSRDLSSEMAVLDQIYQVREQMQLLMNQVDLIQTELEQTLYPTQRIVPIRSAAQPSYTVSSVEPACIATGSNSHPMESDRAIA